MDTLYIIETFGARSVSRIPHNIIRHKSELFGGIILNRHDPYESQCIFFNHGDAKTDIMGRRLKKGK